MSIPVFDQRDRIPCHDVASVVANRPDVVSTERNEFIKERMDNKSALRDLVI